MILAKIKLKTRRVYHSDDLELNSSLNWSKNYPLVLIQSGFNYSSIDKEIQNFKEYTKKPISAQLNGVHVLFFVLIGPHSVYISANEH